MTTTPTLTHLRGALYLFILISTGIVFGRISEMCSDEGKCPDRLAAINAFAVVSFLVCIPLLLCTIISFLPDVVEVALATGLFMFCCVIVGVGTSVSTIREYHDYKGFSLSNLPLGFGWLAMILAASTCYFVFCEMALKEKQVFAEAKVQEQPQGPAETPAPAQPTEAVETVAADA